MGKTIKAYATETWVLKKIQSMKASQSVMMGGGISEETLNKYFDEIDDPDKPGTKKRIAKDTNRVDCMHVLTRDGFDALTEEDKKALLYEWVTNPEDPSEQIARVLWAAQAERIGWFKFRDLGEHTISSETNIDLVDLTDPLSGIYQGKQVKSAASIDGIKVKYMPQSQYDEHNYEYNTLYILSKD